ncbi:MAG: GTP 3',8-cyclase MoaA [Gammaproteobacteria bacterium]|nr:GTP 3',8-cyclase MoaA [Gammaproteobacteria bacterium]
MSTDLIDPFGRTVEYVRLSVTDRCDLRCFYCLPGDYRDFSEPDEWLTFAEIERVIGAFVSLGVRRVRITGGEPLVRKNLPELAGNLARIPGLLDLSLSTNAVGLTRHAEALRTAGISRINVSLDSLRPERFKQITKGNLDKVIAGLMAAKHSGFSPIKINMVVMKGVNDDEIEDMVEFCIEHHFTLRLIETMPIGDTGRSATSYYVDLQEVKARLAERYELIPGVMPGGGPARYVQVAGTGLRIGFITPISQHFCETCNRVRLAVDGTLYLCLGQEHKFEFRPLLRAGISDADLLDTVQHAITLKPERHEFRERPQQIVRFMSMTGG